MTQSNRIGGPNDVPERVGTVLAKRYRLTEYITRGGSSDVWAARDSMMSIPVAIKLLLPHAGAEPVRIRQEITALRLLRLPGVVELLDEGVHDERPFIVMNRIHGLPFPGLPIPCTWTEAKDRVFEMLDILGRIHARGIVHRDIKPANILVDADGHSTYLDFGLSYGIGLGQGIAEDERIMGTFAYLAPEQIRGDDPTPRTDLYAVGVVLYQMLTGTLPHPLSSRQTLFDAKLAGAHRPIEVVARDVPSHVASVIERLLRVEPEERLPTVADVIALLGMGTIALAEQPNERISAVENKPISEGEVVSLFHAPYRSAHLLVAGAPAWDPEGAIVLVEEAREIAERSCLEGQPTRAVAILSYALAAAMRCGIFATDAGHAPIIALFASWVQIALLDNTPIDVDRVLYELSKLPVRPPQVKRFEALLHAAISIRRGGDLGLQSLDAMEPFDDETLERCRQALRVLAARRCDFAQEEAVVLDAFSWAKGSRDPQTHASASGWLGRLRYRQGAFAEAARMHGAAATMETWPVARIAAQLNAASALIEAYSHEDAERWALEAGALAAQCRSPFYELRAKWALRTAQYRRGITLDVDHALIEEVRRLAARDLETVVCLTEAAVALRAEQLHVCRELAHRARQVWQSVGHVWGIHLVRCLEIAAGAPANGSEVRKLAEQALQCPVPGGGIQALGLLASVLPKSRKWLARAAQLAASVPVEHRAKRMDILSVDEIMQSLNKLPQTRRHTPSKEDAALNR